MVSRRLLIALVLTFIIATGIGAVPARANGFASPMAMLTSYYNTIGLRQYQAAYALWITPSQTYDAFVSGYADTDHVTPYLGDYQAGTSNVGQVPGVLVGYRTDGSIVAYHGCFSVAFNDPHVASWAIVNAHFDPLDNAQPDNDLILAYLNVDCSAGPVSIPQLTPTATPDPNGDDMFVRVNHALTTYYELINRKDFAGAYALWLHPLPGPKPNGAPPADYRLPYNQFVSGYNDTKFVDVYPGSYDEEGGYAGHGYVDGKFPVLLVGEHTDGTFVSYIGCYVMGGMQGIDAGIISGAFNKVGEGPDIPSLKATLPALKTICDDVSANLKS